LLALYSVTILTGAALLFLVEPMISRMILPRLGGSSSVWITCVLFFQAALLAGYAYAHGLTRSVATRLQVVVHAAVLALALAVLPLRLPEAAWSSGLPPALRVLALLAVSVGPPFFVLSATGPLLQKWFVATGHREARDPYFLYAAGNAGSLLALLSYPLLVEPALRLRAQRWLFSVGYGLFVALAVACAGALFRKRNHGDPPLLEERRPGEPVSVARRVQWVLLAFVPSSVLLGATQHLTTDVAAVPLLWVIPLALYLVTFILAFSRRIRVSRRAAGYALGLLTVAVAGGLRINFLGVPLWPIVAGHLAAVLAAGLVCHLKLAEDRPSPERLTEFYLLIGLGGALGGVANALLAPLVFDSIAEYPLALVLACALRPDIGSARGAGGKKPSLVSLSFRLAFPVLLAALAIGMELFARNLSVSLRFAIVAVPCVAMLPWPRVSALGLIALMLPAWFQVSPRAAVLHAERTFYGVHRVMRIQPPPIEARDESGQPRWYEVKAYHVLQHGTTGHGIQYPDPELSSVATAYFHRTGPIGQVFAALGEGDRLDRAALIGLGAGTLAAYGRPGRHFTFIEIDPEVVRIARDPRLFTYLRDSKAEVDVIVGDGRIEIAHLPDGEFGLVVVDAFSSDSVPVHMITREAVDLYFRKLRPDGILALHITNEYLDLVPVVDAIAAELGLAGLAQFDARATAEERLERKAPSTWAVLARDRTSLGPLASDGRWESLPRPREAGKAPPLLWTDDYSNLFGVLRGRVRREG